MQEKSEILPTAELNISIVCVFNSKSATKGGGRENQKGEI